MKKYTSASSIGFKLWFRTIFVFSVCFIVYIVSAGEGVFGFYPLFILAEMLLTVPILLALLLLVPVILNSTLTNHSKTGLLTFLLFVPCVIYAGIGGALSLDIVHSLFTGASIIFSDFIILFCGFFGAALIAKWSLRTQIQAYLQPTEFTHQLQSETNLPIINKTTKHMYNQTTSNNLLTKGITVAVLILVMLIPTFFIQNLVTEREKRQAEVTKEVSSKWATAQSLSGPFFTVPYQEKRTTSDGIAEYSNTVLIVPAQRLQVAAKLLPQARQRSIYTVMLYSADVNFSGNFNLQWPEDVDVTKLDLAKARICFSLSDYKGIEQEMQVKLAGKNYVLQPGIPGLLFEKAGLSALVDLTNYAQAPTVPFTMQVNVKGSQDLYFLPLAATSTFNITSKWPSPSFTGNVLPNQRQVSKTGFDANWQFNAANLPFGSVIHGNLNVAKASFFGVSMVQPAGQYDKNIRSSKYAILIIGLTFALIFITELLMKKPFHPVQYVLVGLALIIFYTLLLSLSEYILFDAAYVSSALATILLITLYAKGHFKLWKPALVLCGVLTTLYVFIFVLISLEDTALLVGSIGLFIVLAIVMYVSRNISWYTVPAATNLPQQ